MNIRNANAFNFECQYNPALKSRDLIMNQNLDWLSKNSSVENKESTDFFSDDLISNYMIATLNINRNLNKKSRPKEIPNGYSRYEYNGKRIDIFRRDFDINSQFIIPENESKIDLIEVFPYLEPVIVADDTNEDNPIASVNGEIDENIIQGVTGDCWLIAGLYSVASTEKGKELIKNSITVIDNSTVRVTFAGIGVCYDISLSEFKRHDTDDNTEDDYSNGDNDVLAFELAVEKLWKDINSGRVKLNTENEDLLYTGEGNGIEDGGLPNQLVYYISGIEPKEYYNSNLSNISKDEIYSILSEASKTDNYSLTIGVYNNSHTATLVDGSTFELNLGNTGHALAVVDVNENTLKLVNPWDTSTQYEMTWEEFAKLGIGYISYANLDNAVLADEIVNMTETNDNFYNNNDNYNYYFGYDAADGFDDLFGNDFEFDDYNIFSFRPERKNNHFDSMSIFSSHIKNIKKN